MFDRYYELTVGNKLITIDDLDVEFTIENNSKENAGKAEISVYNLAIKPKIDDVVHLKAGYKQDYGTVFYGKINRVWNERVGADVKTVIQASDMTKDLFKFGYVVKNYAKNTSVAAIVKEMLSLAGIPAGKIQDPGVRLSKPCTFEGSPYQIVKQCLDLVNGEVAKLKLTNPYEQEEWVFYVKNNMGYFVKKDFKDVEVTVLSSETGLMEVKPKSDGEADYEVKCLLQWKIAQDSVVKVESFAVEGYFKVIGFKHVCKANDYYTEMDVKAL